MGNGHWITLYNTNTVNSLYFMGHLFFIDIVGRPRTPNKIKCMYMGMMNIQ